LLVLLVAACGTSTSSPGGTKGTDFSYNPVKPAPKTGGTATVGEWQVWGTTNVLTTTSVADIEVINALWSSCLTQLPDLTLGNDGYKLDQCDQMPTSTNDGKTVTLHFPATLKYSNGNPITSADFGFFVELLADPNVGGAFNPYNELQDIKLPDAQTLVLDFKIAIAPYLNVAAGIQPLPLFAYPGVFDPTTLKYDTTKAQALLGTDKFSIHIPAYNGPFMLQEFTPGQDVIVVKNPNYTSGYYTHPANLDKIIYKEATDKDVLIQAYKSGQYTNAQDFSEADLLKFAGINPKEVVETGIIEYEHFDYNQRPDALNAKLNGGTSIFGGPNGQLVRQAFSEAIDRCKLLSGILGENCNEPGVTTNLNTAPPAADYDPTIPAYKHDAAEAAQLMDQAGYKLATSGDNVGQRVTTTGQPIDVELRTTAGNAVRLSFLTLACQQLASALNITCNAQGVPKLFNFYNQGGVLATSNYDISLFAYENTSDPSGAATNFSSQQIPSATNPAGQNFDGVNDTTLDQMFTAAESELNTATRKADYLAIEKYMYDHYYDFPMYIRHDISLSSVNLGNYKQGSFAEGNFWNVSDWYLNA
jgi:peptide/nickel transport system substrate-binding protein